MLDDLVMENMWQTFKKLGARALSMSHYELALAEDVGKYYPADQWREFIMLPEVDEYIRNESAFLQDIELRKLLSGISNSNSVGRAQLIAQLQKITEGSANKAGPIFIYTYVPLNDAQMHAPNVQVEEKDVFWRD